MRLAQKIILELTIVTLLPLVVVAEGGKKSGRDALTNIRREITDLERLTPAQKKHLELYRQQNKMRLEGKYSPKKCFEPVYAPVVAFARQLKPMTQKAVIRYEQQRDSFAKSGKAQQAKKAQDIINLYRQVVVVCDKMDKAYHDKKTDDMMGAMAEYLNLALILGDNDLKLPPREWLTENEAEMILLRQSRKMKMQRANR